jgi:hypothetical protein
VDDAGIRRHDLEVAKGILSPAQEAIALLVTLEFNRRVLLKGARCAVVIDLHRVVDDQFRWRERVDRLGLAAQLDDSVTHRSQVHDRRYTSEVLQYDPRGGEGDFMLRLLLRIPAGQRVDVLGPDVPAVCMPKQVFEQDLERVGQPADVPRANRCEAVNLVIDAVDGKSGSGIGRFRHESNLQSGGQLAGMACEPRSITDETSGGRPGRQDDAAAQALFSGIEDRVLPGRCRALRDRKIQLQYVPLARMAHFAADRSLSVPQPDIEVYPAGGQEFDGRTIDPVQIAHAESAAQQSRMIVALHHDERIALLIPAGHKPCRLFAVCLPADIESVTLSERVIGQSGMLADRLSVQRHDRPGFGHDVLGQKFPERSLTDKTDAGAVGPGVIGKAVFTCHGPDFVFLQSTEWKERACKCFALYRMQKIGLILVGIGCLVQAPLVALMCHTRVMTRGDVFGTQTLCVVQEGTELDVPIAGHIGIRRPAGPVFSQEIREYLLPIFPRKVDVVKRDAEISGNLLCIGEVGSGGAVLVCVVPVGHVQCFDSMSGAQQAKCRYGGINATGKRNDNGPGGCRHGAKF